LCGNLNIRQTAPCELLKV